ncbi:MAG: alpha/beta fold hydrolase [Succinivibrionaceae bacterium]|nr:alpha/beta fold hydrolase [Succinivibrionaceae bacterium]
MMFKIDVAARRGTVLNGVLFRKERQKTADTAMIAITGIHGNFRSNPFYYNIGETLNGGGYDFVYAQTCDAWGSIRTVNARTGEPELAGSWNERFSYAEDDIEAYLRFARNEGYTRIVLAGHSLGANKVIRYLSEHPDADVDRFFLLSPANLTYMTSEVTDREKQIIREMAESGRGDEMLPAPFMGWVDCIAHTAWDWLFSGILNNVHTARNGDFSQAEKIVHTGALLVGTYDTFTDGDPCEFLQNLNRHMPAAHRNNLVFIEKTGHTYQRKEQELADRILRQLDDWKMER